MVKTWEGLLSWQPLLTASATLTFRSPLLGAEATIKKKITLWPPTSQCENSRLASTTEVYSLAGDRGSILKPGFLTFLSELFLFCYN